MSEPFINFGKGQTQNAQPIIIPENIIKPPVSEQQFCKFITKAKNTNIQCQEIFIDLCKGKKKNIKSKQLKLMYTLFSDNKANMCIFEKIVEEDLRKFKLENGNRDSSTNKWAKDTKGLMEIIEEQQPQTQGKILTDNQLINDNGQPTQSEPEPSRNSVTSQAAQQSDRKSGRSSIFERASSHNEAQEDDREAKFLMKRIYCRLIQKILVKIAFQTMNTKFLDCIALNILQITRNLDTMIRRLSHIKDLRLLQQIILKVYKENLELQNKIFEMLVNSGYIMSIDEFYRINGIDIVHKDVYERNTPDEMNKRYKPTLKEKIMKIKEKKEKENVVKKDHIDRTNHQINDKYMFCVSKIKQILQDEEDEQEINKTKKTEPEKKRSSFSKTQPLPMNSNLMTKKPSRFASGFGIGNILQNKEGNSKPSDSQAVTQSQNSITITHSPKILKPKISYKSRFSSFSPEFTKLIKESSASMKKLQRGSVLSEKFMEFNEFDRGQRKQSKIPSQAEENESERRSKKQAKKSSASQLFSTCAVNKLLKLYQARNTDRYSIDSFLGSAIGLSPQLRQSLRQQLMKLQSIYDSNPVRQPAIKSSFHLSQNHSDSSSSHLNRKYENQSNQDFTQRSNFTNSSSDLRQLQFSSHKALQGHSSSKQQPKPPHQREFLPQEDIKIPDKVIQFIDSNQVQGLILQLSRQNYLIKLSKDRVKKVKTSEKISTQNLPIFTRAGVKNLQTTLKHEEIPFKNEKLKRIPYLKNRQKISVDIFCSNKLKDSDKKTHNDADTTNLPNIDPNNDSKNVQCPKIYKKTYLNSTQSLNVSSFHQKTIKQVVEDAEKRNFYSRQKIVKQQKGRLLHKIATIYENRILKDDPAQSQNMYRTFFPKWINRTVHVNSNQKNVQKFYERTKKVCTTMYQSSSEPVSPRNHGNKQNAFPLAYEIYDIRNRKKIMQ